MSTTDHGTIVQELKHLCQRQIDIQQELLALVYGAPVGALLEWRYGPRKCSYLRVASRHRSGPDYHCWEAEPRPEGVGLFSSHHIIEQLSHGADSLTLQIGVKP